MFMKEYIELNELLKGVIDSLYLCVVVDDRGAIRYLSKSYAEILGVDDLTVVGMPIKKVIPNTGLLRVMETGCDEVGEVFFMKNGEPVICNRIPIRDEEGRLRGALSTATFQNLNTVERLNVEVEKLRQENKLYQEQLEKLKHVPFSMDSVIGNSPVMQSVKN
ncbi:MAG: PAS domain-containing protein, partial [Synergistales bacterium]|nr:PAS domain-containing protein [Synergistales bacterium]